MESTTALLWWHLNVLTKKRYDLLMARFGSLERALQALSPEVLRELGCREETALKAMVRLEEADPDRLVQELIRRDLTLLTLDDDAYPGTLRTLPDPPLFLCVRGDSSLLTAPSIALVGARAMSPYGKRVAEAFVTPIVQSQIVTVSGLAQGIDAEVARETLRHGGRHIAVLGHGMGMMYPKAHTELADEIVEKGGLLVSEFPLDVRPDLYTFPARNRIIAGLTLATVVLEAAEESGSLITAELALDYARDVFAVPGQIFDDHYAGCHGLLKRGEASIATRGEDVLQALGIVASKEPTAVHTFDSAAEEQVFGALTSMPQSLDDLTVKAHLDAAILTATLTMLELKGAARNVGRGTWVRG